MTPVVHLSLGISSVNFEKNQNYGINRGPEEDEGKIPRHCPFKKKLIFSPIITLLTFTVLVRTKISRWGH
jgi:hypothetical protein